MEMEITKKSNTQDNQPTMTVYAGTNGAGKSELTSILKHQRPEIEIIDADEIARRMNPADPSKANFKAGRETLKRVDACIAEKRDFSVETTLAGGNALRQMEKAKQAGFSVNLYYVGLDNVNLHVDRVAQRVSKGGHHIPESDIRRRYTTSLKNLPKAMRLADYSYVFDNTEVYKIKLEISHGQTIIKDPQLPEWVKGVLKDWKGEQENILHDLQGERERLSQQLSETRQQLDLAKSSLVPFFDKQSLERQRDAYSARYEELKPKSFIDKLLQPNRNEITVVQDSIERINNKIENLESQIPLNVGSVQKNVAVLGNAVDSIVKALDRVGQECVAIQKQTMSNNIERTYSKVQHVIQDLSPSIGR